MSLRTAPCGCIAPLVDATIGRMQIHVQTDGAVELLDSGVFTAFEMIGERPATAEATARLAARGIHLVGDHAFVEPASVEDLAGGAVDDRWREQLAGMVSYASSKGWLDDAGRIRAHWASPAT